jgi:hypothetical protein
VTLSAPCVAKEATVALNVNVVPVLPVAAL